MSDNDKTIEFGAYFKEVSVEGYIYLNEADDEKPLRFYDRTGQETWNYPSNPYPENNCGSYDNHVDYEILKSIFQTTDIIQCLVDFADEQNKEITIDSHEGNPIILIING